MIEAVRQWTERVLGRGEAAISVPVLDGALKSNRLIEDADVVAELDAPEDLASDGASLFVADGTRVMRVDGVGAPAVDQTFAATVSALACLPRGGIAVALGGREVRVVGGPHDGRRFESAGGHRLHSVNALAAGGGDVLWATDGSQTNPPDRWKHDVMELGRSGRVVQLDLADGSARERAAGLAYVPFAWPLVDAYHRLDSFAGRRAQHGDPEAALGPDATARALLAALAAGATPTLILHPFLMVDDDGWAAARRVLDTVAAGPAAAGPAGEVAAAL